MRARKLQSKHLVFDYKKSKRILRVSYVVIVFAYTVVTIALSCVGFWSLTENIELLQELNDNWKSHPIIDIILTTTSTCPSQYQENLVEWDFSGFSEGCDCSNVTNSSNVMQGLTKGDCSSAQIASGCSAIAATSSFKMTFWGQTSTSSKICIKRDTNYTFLNTFEASQSSSCPQGYQACIATQQANNRFCVSENSSCPITGLLINSGPCDPTDQNCQNLNTQFNQEKSMSSSTTNDSLPIVEFAVNEYAMCTAKSQQNIYPGRSDYILRYNPRMTCNSEGASLWNLGVIDSMKESDFYNTNGILPLVQAEPEISMYLNSNSKNEKLDPNYNIYARTYVGWNTNCTSYFKDVLEETEHLARLKGAQGSLVAFTVIAGLFTGIVVPSHILSKVLKSKLPLCQKRCSRLVLWKKSSKRNLIHLIKLLPLPSLLTAVAITRSGKNFFQLVGESGCSDPSWNAVFIQISQELVRAHLCDSILLGFLFGLVLVDGVISVWIRRRKRNKSKSNRVAPVTLSVKIPIDVAVSPTSVDRGLVSKQDLSPTSAGMRSAMSFAISSLSP